MVSSAFFPVNKARSPFRLRSHKCRTFTLFAWLGATETKKMESFLCFHLSRTRWQSDFFPQETPGASPSSSGLKGLGVAVSRGSHCSSLQRWCVHVIGCWKCVLSAPVFSVKVDEGDCSIQWPKHSKFKPSGSQITLEVLSDFSFPKNVHWTFKSPPPTHVMSSRIWIS